MPVSQGIINDFNQTHSSKPTVPVSEEQIKGYNNYTIVGIYTTTLWLGSSQFAGW